MSRLTNAFSFIKIKVHMFLEENNDNETHYIHKAAMFVIDSKSQTQRSTVVAVSKSFFSISTNIVISTS